MQAGLPYAMVAAVVGLGYLLADGNRSNRLGPVARGFLVSLNAALNSLLLAWLVAPSVGLLAAAIILPAALPFFSRNRRYQALPGWMNWLLPMSWPVTAVGLLFAWIDLVAFAVWGQGPTRICNITFDPRTCTISIEGGLIVPFRSRGFNMGNFTFLRPGCAAVIPHETGHALNLAVFGAIFHYLGAIDENLPPFRRRSNAYAEHLAESHRSPRQTPLPLRMWG